MVDKRDAKELVGAALTLLAVVAAVWAYWHFVAVPKEAAREAAREVVAVQRKQDDVLRERIRTHTENYIKAEPLLKGKTLYFLAGEVEQQLRNAGLAPIRNIDNHRVEPTIKENWEKLQAFNQWRQADITTCVAAFNDEEMCVLMIDAHSCLENGECDSGTLGRVSDVASGWDLCPVE